MRKGRSIIGLKVIGQMDGSDLGTIKDLVFDYESSEVLALLLTEKDLFGLVDARVVPWSAVRDIGPHAVMTTTAEAVITAGNDARIRNVLARETTLVGKTVSTADGRNLGAFSDIFIEDNGRIVGYEVSGGLFADALGGRQFMPVPSHFVIGKDVAVVPPEIANEMQAKRQAEMGGDKTGGTKADHVKETVAGVTSNVEESVGTAYSSTSQAIGGAYQSSREKAMEWYRNIATQSVERQKEFVIGKVAAHDVIIPAATATTAPEAVVPGEVESGQPVDAERISELGVPTPAVVSDVDSSGEVVEGEVLVRQGEVITRDHADRAAATGVLARLLMAAGSSAVHEAVETGRERIGAATGNAQQQALQSIIGKPTAHDVTDADGSLIVATGMIVTPEIVEHARRAGKENELIAAAGAGAASENVSRGVESVKTGASSLWDTVRQKAVELTEVAQHKLQEFDESAQQRRINEAIGRPTMRVILDRSDNVILGDGEIITHAAVERARAAGVLDVLLDSVYPVEFPVSTAGEPAAHPPADGPDTAAASPPPAWTSATSPAPAPLVTDPPTPTRTPIVPMIAPDEPSVPTTPFGEHNTEETDGKSQTSSAAPDSAVQPDSTVHPDSSNEIFRKAPL